MFNAVEGGGNDSLGVRQGDERDYSDRKQNKQTDSGNSRPAAHATATATVLLRGSERQLICSEYSNTV
jgi:hypothetical protein